MKNGPKYTYTLEKKPLKPVNEIKSNPNFATPGTEFKATKPRTSNQPKTETSGDRAVKSIKKVLGGALTGAAVSALPAKSPYMMYGKKSDSMVSESPLAKYGCSKKYKKSGIKMKDGEKLKLTILSDTDKGEQVKYKGRNVTVKGNTVLNDNDAIGYISKKDGKIKQL